ncbi:hypothetical protein Mapa_013295 [Marchantia paleacea]|nr:hypothetical protein Mapa_013295 [Marchantia paleacea]
MNSSNNLGDVSLGLAPEAAPQSPCPPTHRGFTQSPMMAECRPRTSVPSIFGAN